MIAIVVIAAVGGVTVYVLWRDSLPPMEDIRIGVCADLNGLNGELIWRGAVLAAEQVNAQGGVLGRNLTVIGEDDDSESGSDITVGINALTRLITVDKADYIISFGGVNILPYQDVCCEHKKISISIGVGSNNYSQRVLDNYEKYKYSFRTFAPNDTTSSASMLKGVIALGNYTGFTKVALLFDDFPVGKALASSLNASLPNYGFKIVYNGLFPPLGTMDFTSYLAAVEASGAEILVSHILTQGALPFVKEWWDRQSPFVVWGTMPLVAMDNFWDLTEGKCESVSFAGPLAIAGYPLTNRTVPTWQAFVQRWGEPPNAFGFSAYDAVRFILPEAIRRAGTTETEAVIKALEMTDVVTSMARRFVFTSSHDVLVGSGAPNSPVEDYLALGVLQWQNGTQVLVFPETLMREAGATYKYPSWEGPWSNRQNP